MIARNRNGEVLQPPISELIYACEYFPFPPISLIGASSAGLQAIMTLYIQTLFSTSNY
jgi:hypothetical protein